MTAKLKKAVALLKNQQGHRFFRDLLKPLLRTIEKVIAASFHKVHITTVGRFDVERLQIAVVIVQGAVLGFVLLAVTQIAACAFGNHRVREHFWFGIGKTVGVAHAFENAV